MNRRGEAGERLAAEYLQRQGLQVLTRNHRCRGGEIDLICSEGATLVFVEVRQRARDNFGSAAESIGAAKRARIVACARQYLLSRPDPPPCRFDVVLISGALEAPRIEWLRGAFDADA